MTVRILTGDCRDVLATLPADSVHCCVTRRRSDLFARACHAYSISGLSIAPIARSSRKLLRQAFSVVRPSRYCGLGYLLLEQPRSQGQVLLGVFSRLKMVAFCGEAVRQYSFLYAFDGAEIASGRSRDISSPACQAMSRSWLKVQPSQSKMKGETRIVALRPSVDTLVGTQYCLRRPQGQRDMQFGFGRGRP